jgi:hypothetical protein
VTAERPLTRGSGGVPASTRHATLAARERAEAQEIRDEAAADEVDARRRADRIDPDVPAADDSTAARVDPLGRASVRPGNRPPRRMPPTE